MPPWESKLSLGGFAQKVRIPKSTLGAYLNGEKCLGKGAGRPALLSRGETTFVCDIVRRHDRARDGLGAAEVVDKVSDLRPDLTSAQAKNLAYQVRKRNSEVQGVLVRRQMRPSARWMPWQGFEGTAAC